jgi:opacity protein-like surface antigen
MKNTKLLAALGVVALTSILPPALAGNGSRIAPQAHKRYAAVDIGGSRARGEFSDGFVAREPGADTTETSTGFAIRFGYQFNRYLAAEIGYADFGDFTFGFDPGDCPVSFQVSCDVTMRTSISGPLINVVGLIPLNDRWTLKGRAGFFHADVSSRLNGSTTASTPSHVSEDNNGLHFGAAVSYHINDNIEVELGWVYFEQFDLGLNLSGAPTVFTQGSSSLASLGLAYRF